MLNQKNIVHKALALFKFYIGVLPAVVKHHVAKSSGLFGFLESDLGTLWVKIIFYIKSIIVWLWPMIGLSIVIVLMEILAFLFANIFDRYFDRNNDVFFKTSVDSFICKLPLRKKIRVWLLFYTFLVPCKYFILKPARAGIGGCILQLLFVIVLWLLITFNPIFYFILFYQLTLVLQAYTFAYYFKQNNKWFCWYFHNLFNHNVEFFDYVVFKCLGNPSKATGSILSRIIGAAVVPIGGGELKKELEARNVIRHTKALHVEAETRFPSASQAEFALNRKVWRKTAREECLTPMMDFEDKVKAEGSAGFIYTKKLAKELFE